MVHENPQIGSDGESEEGSRHSDTAAVSAQSSAAASVSASGGATGTSSSSDLYSSRGAGGMGSGEGKVSFTGKMEELLFSGVSDKVAHKAICIGFRERTLWSILLANDVMIYRMLKAGNLSNHISCDCVSVFGCSMYIGSIGTTLYHSILTLILS